MLRFLALLALLWTVVLPVSAQEATVDTRASTGGAQNLEDILRRQEGIVIDDSFRSVLTGNPDAAASINDQLGTLGGASDPDLGGRCGMGQPILPRKPAVQP